ncbi:hypothetical protein GCM10023320_49740 [Pseudonocardia adelaidensis]|uniref:Major facilitator superfamily (MFS) profile domain-containing protein n=2 Tax=Pseudonocardia adelaidensis TaxID=648754 RepID=A0ABP9NPD0_9PSEU
MPPADVLQRIARALELPLPFVRSLALDTSIDFDVPAAIGLDRDVWHLRFHGFDTRLGLVRAALDELREQHEGAAAALHQALTALADTMERHSADAVEAMDAARGAGMSVRRIALVARLPSGRVRELLGDPERPSPSAADLRDRVPALWLVVVLGRLVLVIIRAIWRVVGFLARGPPWRRGAARTGRSRLVAWRGPGRELWEAVSSHLREWQRRAALVEEELAAGRRRRLELSARAGGVLGLVASDGVQGGAEMASLVTSNRWAALATRQRDAAYRELLEAIRPAVRHAAERGLSNRRIAALLGLDWMTVSELSRRPEGDPRERLRWIDWITGRWIGFWGLRHRPSREEVTLASGETVTLDELGRIARQIGRGGAYSLAMLVDGQVVGLVGGGHRPVYDLSDVHYHHVGYDDPRNTSIERFLGRLRAAGHQGVITFHPIPQRGMGVATVGGSFYYLIAAVQTLGLVFGIQMLQMWGKFPDVRLLDAIRALPDELRWRAVLGVVGARMDVPGGLGYLRLMAILNPDLAELVGETTIAKEAVTDMLGPQAIQTINPEWVRLVQRLINALALLRQMHEARRLSATRLHALPPALVETIAGASRFGSEAIAAGLVAVLVENVEGIAALLEPEHRMAAIELRAAATRMAAGTLPMYNPHLRELLEASAEIGYLVVLHNDFGMARVTGTGRFADVAPDERFGSPLLALLSEYGPLSNNAAFRSRPAKIVLAHLGVGKFTNLTVEHLDLLDTVLSDPRYGHIDFDISWNEVTRQLLRRDEQGGTPVLDRFIKLVESHPERFLFGSDAVKPESNAQYFRQHHDAEEIFGRVLAEVGEEAFVSLRHRRLETRLAEAKRDVQQWVFNALSDEESRGSWEEVLAQVRPERRRIVLRWMAAQRGRMTRTAPGIGPDYTCGDGVEMHWRHNRQLLSLIRWHNAVTPQVVAGRRLSLALIWSALRASWLEHRHQKAERQAAKKARKAAEVSELEFPTGTGVLGLRDENHQPYSVEALVAAHQAGRAAGPEWARTVLAWTHESQLRRLGDRAELERQRRRMWRGTWIAATVIGAGIAVGGWLMWSVVSSTAAIYVAFAVRGALNVHRGIYAQQMRVLVESILERGQLNLHTVRRLQQAMRKYAAFDRVSQEQLDRFDAETRRFLVYAAVVLNLDLQPGESAEARNHEWLRQFSIHLDTLGNIVGGQAQSLHGLSPNGGLLGRLLNTALALTFVVDLLGHVAGMFTGGFPAVVSAAFALSDLLFLGQTLPAAISGWAGYDLSAHPLARKLVHLVAMPVIAVANALLTVQFGWVAPSAMIIPAITLTLSSGYLAVLGVIAEAKLGRLQPRRGAWANGVLSASLLAFGVITLAPERGWTLGFTAAGAAFALWAISKIDRWLSNRSSGPPPWQRRQLESLATQLHGMRTWLDDSSTDGWTDGQRAALSELEPELARAESMVAGLRGGFSVSAHLINRAESLTEYVVGELGSMPGAPGGGRGIDTDGTTYTLVDARPTLRGRDTKLLFTNDRTGAPTLFKKPGSAYWRHVEVGLLGLARFTGFAVPFTRAGTFDGEWGIYQEMLQEHRTLARIRIEELPQAALLDLVRALALDYAINRKDPHAENFLLAPGREVIVPIDFGYADPWVPARSVRAWIDQHSGRPYHALFRAVRRGRLPARVVDQLYRASMEQTRRIQTISDTEWGDALEAALRELTSHAEFAGRGPQLLADALARKNDLETMFAAFWAEVFDELGRQTPEPGTGTGGPNPILAVVGLTGALLGLPALLGRSGTAAADVLHGGPTGSDAGIWADVLDLAGSGLLHGSAIGPGLAGLTAAGVIAIVAGRRAWLPGALRRAGTRLARAARFAVGVAAVVALLFAGGAVLFASLASAAPEVRVETTAGPDRASVGRHEDPTADHLLELDADGRLASLQGLSQVRSRLTRRAHGPPDNPLHLDPDQARLRVAETVARALPRGATRIVDSAFLREVGLPTAAELRSALHGDARFALREQDGHLFVRSLTGDAASLRMWGLFSGSGPAVLIVALWAAVLVAAVVLVVETGLLAAPAGGLAAIGLPLTLGGSSDGGWALSSRDEGSVPNGPDAAGPAGPDDRTAVAEVAGAERGSHRAGEARHDARERAPPSRRIARLLLRVGLGAAAAAALGGILAAALGGVGTTSAAPAGPRGVDTTAEPVLTDDATSGNESAFEVDRSASVVVRVGVGDTVDGFTRRFGLFGYDRVTSDAAERAAGIRSYPDLIFEGELLRLLLPAAPPVPPRGGHVPPDGGLGPFEPADGAGQVDAGTAEEQRGRLLDTSVTVLIGVIALLTLALLAWQRTAGGRLRSAGQGSLLEEDLLPGRSMGGVGAGAAQVRRSQCWRFAAAAALTVVIARVLAVPTGPAMALAAGLAVLVGVAALLSLRGRWQWVAVGVAGALFVVIAPVLLVLALPAWLAVASSAAFGLRGGLNLRRPRAGPLGALGAMPLLGTFVVNLVVLVPGATTGSALDRWISGLYATTVAAFGLGAVAATDELLRNRNAPWHRLVGGLVTWVAFPVTSNVGNVLLAFKLGWVAYDPVLLAVTVVLAVTFANASVLGMVAARHPGRFSPSYLAAMGAAGNVSLLYWGLFAVWPRYWAELTAVGVGAALVCGVSRFAAWRARLIHSPPPGAALGRALINVGLPALFAIWTGAGLVDALHLDRPTTITAVAVHVTVVALWVIHRLVPRSDRAPSPARTGRAARVSGRGAIVFGATALLGVAGAYGSGLLGGATPAVATVMAVLVSPLLALLVHRVWTRGPPWARLALKVAVVVVVATAILTSGGSAASANVASASPDGGWHISMGPVPTVLTWAALGMLGAVVLAVPVVALVRSRMLGRSDGSSETVESLLDAQDELNREYLDAVKAELPGTDPRLAGIRSIENRLALAAREGPRVLLLEVGVEGRGHATIAVGDPATAAHVAVIVPGTGHDLSTVDVAIRQADLLWLAAAQTDPGTETAIVARWGDSPADVRRAVSLRVARLGASRLRAFLGGLRASRRGPPAHVTVVAHSYGTVLAGYAARVFGLPIDDLVLLASPGTTAGHVSELNLPADHVWAGTAARDPIRFIPRWWHRISPMVPRFGARIFPTGSGGTGGLGLAHDSYVREHSTALAHVMAIVVGRGEQVPIAPRAISGIAAHVDRHGVTDAALMDAVDYSLTPPVHRDDERGTGWIFVGAEAMVVLDAEGGVLAVRPRSSLLGERNGQILRRLAEMVVQLLRKTGEPAKSADRPGRRSSTLTIAVLTAAALVLPAAAGAVGRVSAEPVGAAVGAARGGVTAALLNDAAGAVAPLGSVAAVVAVAVMVLVVLHHVWPRAPPWARAAVRIFVLAAMVAVPMVVAASRAWADAGAHTSGPSHDPSSATVLGLTGVAVVLVAAAAVVRAFLRVDGALWFGALKEPAFRKYAAGQAVSRLFRWMQVIAQDWLVLELSGYSGTALALVSTLQFAPMLLAPVAGVVVDRSDLRRLLIRVQVVLGSIALLLGLGDVVQVVQLWLVYGLSLVSGLVAAIDSPARDAFVRRLVDKVYLVNAIGLLAMAEQLSKTVGPALGGVLIEALGPGVAFLMNAAGYAVVVASLLLIRPASSPVARPDGLGIDPRGWQRGRLLDRLRSMRRDLTAGLSYVRSRPELLAVLTAVGVVTTFGMNLFLKLPLLVTDGFGGGPAAAGALSTALGIGALVGSGVAARRSKAPPVQVVLAWGLALSVLVTGAGMIHSLLWTAIVLAFAGAAEFLFILAAKALLQNVTEDMTGRVMGLFQLVYMGGIPLASWLIGVVADHDGRAPMWGGGVLSLAGLLGVWWWLGRKPRTATPDDHRSHDRQACPRPHRAERIRTAIKVLSAGVVVIGTLVALQLVAASSAAADVAGNGLTEPAADRSSVRLGPVLPVAGIVAAVVVVLAVFVVARSGVHLRIRRMRRAARARQAATSDLGRAVASGGDGPGPTAGSANGATGAVSGHDAAGTSTAAGASTGTGLGAGLRDRRGDLIAVGLGSGPVDERPAAEDVGIMRVRMSHHEYLAVVVRVDGPRVTVLIPGASAYGSLLWTVGERTRTGIPLRVPGVERLADELVQLDPGAAALPREDLLASLAGEVDEVTLWQFDAVAGLDIAAVHVAEEPSTGEQIAIVGHPMLRAVVGLADGLPVVIGGVAAPELWGATRAAGPWHLVMRAPQMFHTAVVFSRHTDPDGGAKLVLVGYLVGTTRSVVDRDGTEITTVLVSNPLVLRAHLAARGLPVGAPATAAARVMTRWRDSPLLPVHVGAIIDAASNAIARANALPDTALREIASLTAEAMRTANDARIWVERRHPNPLAARFAQLDSELADAMDRLWGAATASARRFTRRDGGPLADMLSAMAYALEIATAEDPYEFSAGDAAARRRLDRTLAFVVSLSTSFSETRFGRPPTGAGDDFWDLRDHIGDIFDLLVKVSRSSRGVPAKWSGAPAVAAACWLLDKVELDLSAASGESPYVLQDVRTHLADVKLLTRGAHASLLARIAAAEVAFADPASRYGMSQEPRRLGRLATVMTDFAGWAAGVRREPATREVVAMVFGALGLGTAALAGLVFGVLVAGTVLVVAAAVGGWPCAVDATPLSALDAAPTPRWWNGALARHGRSEGIYGFVDRGVRQLGQLLTRVRNVVGDAVVARERSGTRWQVQVAVVLVATVMFVLLGSPVAAVVVGVAVVMGSHLWARGPPLRVLGAALLLAAVVAFGWGWAVGGPDAWAWGGADGTPVSAPPGEVHDQPPTDHHVQLLWPVLLTGLGAVGAFVFLMRNQFHRWAGLRQRLVRAVHGAVRISRPAVLGVRNFRLFVIGGLVWMTINWGSALAKSTLALQLTGGEERAAALMVVAYSLPVLLLSPLVGLVLDRHSKRTVLLIADFGTLAVMAWLGWLVLTSRITFPGLIGLALLEGVFDALRIPAAQAFVPELVPRRDRPAAFAIRAMIPNVAQLIGASIATLLLGLLGPGGTIALNAVGLAVNAAMLLRMNPRMTFANAPQSHARGQLRAAMAHVWKLRKLRRVLALSSAVMLLGTQLLLILTVLAAAVPTIGLVDVGLLFAALAMGQMLGNAVTAKRAGLARERELGLLAAAWGALLLVVSQSSSVVGVGLVLVVTGIFMAMFMTRTEGLVQNLVDATMRGRLAGLRTLLDVGTAPLASGIVALTAGWLGGRAPLAAAGVIPLLASIVLLAPQLSRLVGARFRGLSFVALLAVVAAGEVLRAVAVWARGGGPADRYLRAGVAEHRGLRQDMWVADDGLEVALAEHRRLRGRAWVDPAEMTAATVRVASSRELRDEVVDEYRAAVAPVVAAAVDAGLPAWRIAERTGLDENDVARLAAGPRGVAAGPVAPARADLVSRLLRRAATVTGVVLLVVLFLGPLVAVASSGPAPAAQNGGTGDAAGVAVVLGAFVGVGAARRRSGGGGSDRLGRLADRRAPWVWRGRRPARRPGGDADDPGAARVGVGCRVAGTARPGAAQAGLAGDAGGRRAGWWGRWTRPPGDATRRGRRRGSRR